MISDPDLWPRDFVQRDTLPALVGKHEDEVLETLGFPTYVLKRGETLSYLYQDLDADTGIPVVFFIIPLPYLHKGTETRCVLLNFNSDGMLQEYEIKNRGSGLDDPSAPRVLHSCADLLSITDSEFIDPRIHVSIEGDLGIEDQYQWYVARPPCDPTRLPYLCRAADGGHPNAQIEVGRHFAEGVCGVRQDLRHAYVWYSLAKTRLPEIAHLRLILPKMTSEQIAEAEQMLADWKPGQCDRVLIGQ